MSVVLFSSYCNSFKYNSEASSARILLIGHGIVVWMQRCLDSAWDFKPDWFFFYTISQNTNCKDVQWISWFYHAKFILQLFTNTKCKITTNLNFLANHIFVFKPFTPMFISVHPENVKKSCSFMTFSGGIEI